jgi:hypothetical protein
LSPSSPKTIETLDVNHVDFTNLMVSNRPLRN